MPELPNVDDFPSFGEVKPLDEGFTCIWYLPDEKERCGNRINRDNRRAAASVHRELLETPPGGDLIEKSTLLAELTCCKRYHLPKLRKSDLGASIPKRWRREIRTASPVPSDIERKASCSADSKGIRPKETAGVTCIHSPEHPPRHNLRSRTVCDASSCPTTVKSESQQHVSHFVPRTSASGITFSTKLLEPLEPPTKKKKQQENSSPSWQKKGSIYCFSRNSDPGMLKIGRTIKEFVAEDVPHVLRAEALVHYELQKYWRRETKCRHNPDCIRKHQEWFEVDIETAKKAIKNISTWLRFGHPYDEQGYLVDRWRRKIYKMERKGIEVTAQALVDALHDMESKAKQIEPSLSSPETNRTGRSPGRNAQAIALSGAEGKALVALWDVFIKSIPSLFVSKRGKSRRRVVRFPFRSI